MEINRIKESYDGKKIENDNNININKENDKDKIENKTFTEFSNNIYEDDLLPANLEKECCWNCLKIILKQDSLNVYLQDNLVSDKVVKNF